MPNHATPPNDPSLNLTATDLRRAATVGVISSGDAQRLIEWAGAHVQVVAPPPQVALVEQPKGLNLVTVAYYFGALLIMGACGWFLGDKWDDLGPQGVLLTALLYAVVCASLGRWLRGAGYKLGGGLLITVAVCMTPLVVYAIEDLAGIWPRFTAVGINYDVFNRRLTGCHVSMELATVAVAAVTLWFVRFPFLTAPLAFACWLFAMHAVALFAVDVRLDQNARSRVTMAVGLATLLIGLLLDRAQAKRAQPHGEDYGFWCNLFGMFGFWGGLTWMDGGDEFGRFIYLLVNIALIGAAVKFKRSVMLIFGAIGVHIYLGYLAYSVFRDSLLFPFAVALLGLSLIACTVLAQRFMNRQRVRRALRPAPVAKPTDPFFDRAQGRGK
jgi:hypothetical protein